MLEASLFGPEIAVVVGLAGAASLLARLTKQPAPLLFLIAGLAAGPGLGLVTPDPAIDSLTGFGLLFLLFLIGLEMKLDRLKPMLRQTIWISPSQMLITFIVFTVFASLFFPLTAALVIALATTYSSTAVVLRLLSERREIDTAAGRLDMGLLLFEDMTIILVIAVLTTGGIGERLIITAARAFGAVGLLAALAAVIAWVLPRVQGSSSMRSLFVQSVGWLFLFVGVADLLGVSHEIGAFFAGVALAQLPAHDELHERVRPLTDLFMALFFIGIGLQLQTGDLLAHWKIAVVAAVLVMVDKFAVHRFLFRAAGYDRETVFRGSINMTQTSEFSIVLGATALAAGLVDAGVLGFLTLVALLTMTVSTVLIDRQDWLYRAMGGSSSSSASTTDALVVGFGPSAMEVLDVIAKQFDDITVVAPLVEAARQLDGTPYTHIFADIRHEEIRRESGFEEALLIVVLYPDPETGLEVLEEADEQRVLIVTQGADRAAAFREAGADRVFDSSELLGERLASELEEGGGRD